jgi:hypothetical protein
MPSRPQGLMVDFQVAKNITDLVRGKSHIDSN